MENSYSIQFSKWRLKLEILPRYLGILAIYLATDNLQEEWIDLMLDAGLII